MTTATDTKDLLFEVGTEELPPKALLNLAKALASGLESGLKKAELRYSSTRFFATPRRLAVLVSELQVQQNDRESVRFGPAVKAAFDAEGKPTKAAEGFARSCGVELDALGREEKDGVEKLCFRELVKGSASSTLLPGLIEQSLAQLPVPKRMRWGASREEFVRPVHWVVLMLGEDVVPFSLFDNESSDETFGHRFLHNEAIALESAADYEESLEEVGGVIPDFAKRRELIRRLVIEEGDKIGAVAQVDEDLLNEVTSLVEYPVALTGNFDPLFLEVPPEALVLTMKSHQKCFCLYDDHGRLLPHFIAVSNIVSKDPAKVIQGNERVIRPRLADARFFYDNDRQRSLESRIDKLKTLVFQEQLGTVFDKTQRVARLAGWLADRVGADTAMCQRAAQLAKSDLLTDMVGEFAELQGLMGYYYARNEGEPEELARALNEQYQPRQAGGAIPETLTGAVLAIADKVDSIVGMFGIGQPPTGSKDPFALRRSAIGVLRILIEKELDVDIQECLVVSVESFGSSLSEAGVADQVFHFLLDRFRAWYADEGVDSAVFQSVLALKPSRPLDFDRRIQAVQRFIEQPEASALAAANKRVSNLLDKQGGDEETAPINLELLQEKEEQKLQQALADIEIEVAPLFKEGQYTEGLLALAKLRGPVDEFFDQVLVMADDTILRSNRLALLDRLRQLFLKTADISHLHKS